MIALLGIVLVVTAYVAGSIPFGVVVGRLMYGVDPRDVGSGNIGAANAMRALGKVGGALVLVGDALKGAAPTLAALLLFPQSAWIVAAVGLAAVIGHNWPVFLGFRGGKGVATGLGVVAVLSWQAALAFALLWLAVVAISRYSSLGSMIANAAMPVALFVLHAPAAYVAYACAALALVLWRHEANIRRLMTGTELRVGAAK